MTKNVLTLLLSLSCFTLLGQGKADTIPFELTEHNNLSVQAILNGHDTVRLMFHTANYGIDLTAAAIKRLAGLRFERTDTVKSWGGDDNASRVSPHNSLSIGELKWPDIPVWEDVNSGQGTDGKFGPDLFAGKAIEIDYDARVIVIRDSLPDNVRKYDKLKLVFEKHNLYLEASCKIGGKWYANRFLIHSGYFGAILLDDAFVARTGADERLKIVGEKDLKDSYGHVLKTEKALLPVLAIGGKKLHAVPVGFFHGAIGSQKMSIIGGDLLKRFNLIIDAQREYIYLKPNHLLKMAYLS
jgi:hypothetical protein